MKATELRVGNLIDYEHTTHVVTAVSNHLIESEWLKDRTDNYIADPRDYSGVPLTEEWLVRFGFHDDTYSNFSKIINEFMWIVVSFEDYACTKLVENPVSVADFDLDIECKYIHQLQNLYFSLTGEELELIDRTNK